MLYYIILYYYYFFNIYIYTCLALAFMGGYTPTNRTGGGHRTPPWNKWWTGPALWALIEARVVGMEVGSKISPCFPLGLKEFQGFSFAVPLFHWFSLFLGGRCGSQELDCFSFHVGGFMGGKRRYQLSPKYFKVVIFWRFHSACWMGMNGIYQDWWTVHHFSQAWFGDWLPEYVLKHCGGMSYSNPKKHYYSKRIGGRSRFGFLGDSNLS